jgi:hypothetical protein
MVETELVLSVIRTLGVLIGVVIAVYEIMNIGRTRKMELLTRLATNWTSAEFNKNWTEVLFHQYFSNVDEWREYYNPTVNLEAYSKLQSVLTSYNNIGSLVKNKIFKPEFIWESHTPLVIIALWEKLKPLAEHWRNVFEDPTVYKQFEYLYDETKKKHPKTYYQPGESYLEARERWLAERKKG